MMLAIVIWKGSNAGMGWNGDQREAGSWIGQGEVKVKRGEKRVKKQGMVGNVAQRGEQGEAVMCAC